MKITKIILTIVVLVCIVFASWGYYRFYQKQTLQYALINHYIETYCFGEPFSSFNSVKPDLETFSVISTPGDISSSKGFSKDKYSVYFNCYSIPNADPKTFELLIGKYEDVDKNHIYYWTSYAKDRYHVYGVDQAPGYIYKEMDASSFSIISNSLNKDKNHVYIVGNVLDGADPKTFSELTTPDGGSSFFYKDKNNVYFGSFYKVVDNADPASFTFVYDDNGVINRSYMKDKDNVYVIYPSPIDMGEGTCIVLKGADSATFMSVHNKKGYDAQDKYHRYNEGLPVD